jgi:CubicO group peptidase (beta-lactamase class C family)
VRIRTTVIVGALALGVLLSTTPARGQGFVQGLFEQYLESLRRQAGIPGISAAIVHDGHVAWERGFGHQDVAGSVPALPDTPYPVGGITETLAATLVLQCAERGQLDVDAPLRTYTSTAAVPEPGATVRQVLSHTSAGVFRYDPQRFQALTGVVESCAKASFRQVLAESILDRLGMHDSVPGQDLDDPDAAVRAMFSGPVLAHYSDVTRRMATPYRGGSTSPSRPPRTGLDAATGLVSTVRDLARFDAALDEGVLLRPSTVEIAFTPVGASAPAGLGWFVQTYRGHRLVWHFGVWRDAYSSLIVKVPDRRLTLILLANSDGLVSSFSLGAGDVTASLFARLFLNVYL